jgi:hypothetical protein
MNQQELLAENRAMGWPSCAPHPQRFADKVAEFRRNALANPAEYRARCEREERQLATHTVRRVTPAPVVLSLKARLDAAADQIRRDFITASDCTAVYRGADGLMHRDFAREREQAREDFSADGQAEWRRNVLNRYSPLAVEAASEDGGAVSDPEMKLRCGSMTSTADDHKWGASAHNVIARKLITRGQAGSPDTPDYQTRADKHFRAAEAHAAVGSPDTPDYQVRCARACGACAAATSLNKA